MRQRLMTAAAAVNAAGNDTARGAGDDPRTGPYGLLERTPDSPRYGRN